MTTLPHLMIMASAGAGKTYALTTRFVRLLALGAAPERIVALTFTRKAAGEFFDAILNRLAQAATDERAAGKLAQEIEVSGLGTADFLRLLRAMIGAMPQLNLGTLDGFFARMVQAFPLELGLSGEFNLLEEATARQERQRVLSHIFTQGLGAAKARDDFIEAFKRATYGVEEKALQRSLDAFLDQHGETYRMAPDPLVWGNGDRIWPPGADRVEPPSIPAAVLKLQACLPWSALNDRQRGRMESFLAELEEWVVGAILPQDVAYVMKNTLAVDEALRAGAGEITLERKKVSLGPEASRGLSDLVHAIIRAEVGRKLEITRGVHAVLAFYEEIYDNRVRRAGKLTFGDVQRLLEPGRQSALGLGDRELIDWRLDSRFDHWLLDEFQDTSRGQWGILHNLVDEAVQDAEGRRSFFYVGDVKQAIYSWRGGDSRLFREIFNYYNAESPDTIEEQHLAVSWRSAPPVIEMVNAVFGCSAALEKIAPMAAVERWMGDWRAHQSARTELRGFAELREAEGEEGRFHETLMILEKVRPANRGLTVAVLVQKNDTGARLAEYLRREGGIAAVAESDLKVAFDNPLTCALLALLKAAAHPRDSLATELVKMTPVAGVLTQLGWTDPSRICLEVLREVHEGGFSGMLAKWVARMDPLLEADDPFSRMRGRQLVEASRAFDESGERDVAQFLDWAQVHTLRETISKGMVRVMTVHKAKGLGFDLVILPDLQGQSIGQRREGLAVHRDAQNEVDWVLDLPNKLMAESDPTLRLQLESEEAEEAYEAFCRLYVALTRAKQGLYVLIEPVGKSTSRNYPKLLCEALEGEWSCGDEAWFESERPPEAKGNAPADFGIEKIDDRTRIKRRLAKTPSKTLASNRRGADWFATTLEESASRGNLIHDELALIEWLNELELSRWIEQRELAGIDSEVVQAVRTCLENEALRSVFECPGDPAFYEVWRERPFEIARTDAWISGVFDRVVCQRDRSGGMVAAWVYDFKTGGGAMVEDVQPVAKQYEEQIMLYRKAVAKLTGLPLEKIGGELIFTDTGVRISVS